MEPLALPTALHGKHTVLFLFCMVIAPACTWHTIVHGNRNRAPALDLMYGPVIMCGSLQSVTHMLHVVHVP